MLNTLKLGSTGITLAFPLHAVPHCSTHTQAQEWPGYHSYYRTIKPMMASYRRPFPLTEPSKSLQSITCPFRSHLAASLYALIFLSFLSPPPVFFSFPLLCSVTPPASITDCFWFLTTSCKDQHAEQSSLIAVLFLSSHVLSFLILIFPYISYLVSLLFHLHLLPSLPLHSSPPLHSVPLHKQPSFPTGVVRTTEPPDSPRAPTTQSHQQQVNKQDGKKGKWSCQSKPCIQNGFATRC